MQQKYTDVGELVGTLLVAKTAGAVRRAQADAAAWLAVHPEDAPMIASAMESVEMTREALAIIAKEKRASQ